ncbi:magnesium transporter [Bacteriovorax sp. DB6_IX]|uniref:magnesium transporter n=1 Tax=Bacteriovorax sp. DB6_IX TaxID=1353530 RepID=UPI00038A1AEA|nr:magnesium transporter [Bacteriovorax sp. DB6_IX]EQC51849.1 magnesium transporter [Bacteriovorax sp. DB6_IX]
MSAKPELSLEENFQSKLDQVINHELEIHDLKELLLEIREEDQTIFQDLLLKVPRPILAETVAELPDYVQEEVSDFIAPKEMASIAEEMDSDDAAEFIRNISDNDEDKASDILQEFQSEERKVIEKLISYDDDVAGAHMQSELFSASIDEHVWKSIDRLKTLKRTNQIDNIYHVFVTDLKGKFICSIGLEELIISNKDETYQSFLDHGDFNTSKTVANHNEEIEKVVEMVSDYNLSVIPIVDDYNNLVGRITSDDVYDIIEELATDDIYHMAGVNAEAEDAEKLMPVIKTRAFWLMINLMTAIAASYVISYFDSTIQAFVSLAILMPIIASMGGNAGTQSLTVTVRQLSIGEISSEDALDTIKKEVLLSLINGLLFAFVVGVLAYAWFQLPTLGIVIALAIIINLLFAGLFGSLIPLLLEKLDIDPAIASTVLLTTITDIVGFFAFLGLAKLIMF